MIASYLLNVQWIGFITNSLSGGQDSAAGKNLDMQSIDRSFDPHYQRVFFRYGPLASPSLQIPIVGSNHHG